MRNTVFIPLSLAVLLTLSGCSSTKPLSWAEKELKYGPACENEGLEKGAPEYLYCVAESYQDGSSSRPPRSNEKSPSSAPGSTVMPWEMRRESDNRVSHGYGRPENGSPDVPVLDKAITW